MLEFISTHWVKLYAGASMVFYAFIWVMNKTYSTKKDTSALEQRVARLETDVKLLPTKDEMHQLELKVNTVCQKIDGLSQQLVKLQRTTDMLLENELQGDRK